MDIENPIWNTMLVLNGLFLVFLGTRVWKVTAGRRALWLAHLSGCFIFFVQFFGATFIYDVVLMQLAYATGATPYPYQWMNTLAFSALLSLLLFVALEYLFLWRIADRWLKRAKSNTRGRWAPFVSPIVREIHAHMTSAEKSKMEWHAGLYGLFVGGTFAIPLTNIINGHPSFLLLVISVILIAIYFVCLPLWLKMQKQSLCSTAWAKEQGLTPDQLKLFAFRFKS